MGSSPQTPTAGDLFTNSGKIIFWKTAPTYPAMLTSSWIFTIQGANDLAGNGYTKIKIASSVQSELTFPVPSIVVSGPIPSGGTYYNYPFPAPGWMTAGGQPFTMKFYK